MEQVEILDYLEDFKEDYKTRIYKALAAFQASRNIEDLTAITQNRWNAALMYIAQEVFKDKSNLRARPYDGNNLIKGGKSNNNAWSIDKLDGIADIYINMCYEFDKEVSIMGFSHLLGIDDSIIHQWGSGYSNGEPGASTTGSNLCKKLRAQREESLSNIALSGKRNPVGVIAVLNNKCGWSTNNQTIREERRIVIPESRAQLAAEFGLAIEQKPE